MMKTSNVYDMIEIKINDSHPHAYKAHLHSELSVGVIEKGATVLIIDDVDYRISEGEAVIIMPYVVHNCQPVDINNWAFTMIYLDDSYKDALIASLSEPLKIGISKLGPKEYQLIKSLTKILKSEESPFVKEVEIIDCLNSIVESIELSVSRKIDCVIEEIKFFIENNLLEDLVLDDLASRFNINKFSMIRRFKQLYDITPSAYQLQLKVNYAKQLLKKESDLVEVALQAGFYDQAHFTREFKKSTGITPKFYIKSIP